MAAPQACAGIFAAFDGARQCPPRAGEHLGAATTPGKDSYKLSIPKWRAGVGQLLGQKAAQACLHGWISQMVKRDAETSVAFI
jgi:hypothetical protein